jgi:urea carboxylase-associated protein 2
MAHDPAALRKRYEELKAQAQEAGAFEKKLAAAPGLPERLEPELIDLQDTIPPGWYWQGTVLRGQGLRLANPQGSPGVSLQIWALDDPSERFNAADTVKLQWTARIGKGRVLFSDMGRVMASIVDDTCGLHDCIVGHSTRLNARPIAEAESTDGPFRNSRDNFLLAASKFGLGKRDLHPSITFFAGTEVDEEGRLGWNPACTKPSRVDLRFEMDCLVALSNCPHPLAPADAPAKPVEFYLWEAPPPGMDDLCRTGTEEAVRGFENTDPFYA